VSLVCGERQAELIILDNGCGFEPQAVAPNHLGLDIMRERAQSVGARLALESRPECGTIITVRWNVAQLR
jgi:nitrate/nitrite-specific signal transduction histidine kinase